MKHYKIILILTLVFCSFNSIGQTDSAFIKDTKFIIAKSDTFLVSTKPVTNREYIIYLLWLYSVDGVDYPETFFNAVPGLSQKNASHLLYESYDPNKIFGTIFNYTQPFVKNYMFNPKFIDYPVVGVTWLQANKFCKWLSDRFNEYKLIKDGYFMPDQGQSNEECFITESYLADEYYGVRNKAKENVTLKWTDRLLIPAFRLPTALELDIAKKQKSIDANFKANDFKSTDFLNQWNDWYIGVTEDKLILKYNYSEEPCEIDATSKAWDLKKYNYAELCLDINYQNDSLNVIEIFKKHNQNIMDVKTFNSLEKDSLGQMPYIIIDEDGKQEPVAVAKYNRSDGTVADTSKLYYFRYCILMKNGQYKP
jgi:hypothetical protein